MIEMKKGVVYATHFVAGRECKTGPNCSPAEVGIVVIKEKYGLVRYEKAFADFYNVFVVGTNFIDCLQDNGTFLNNPNAHWSWVGGHHETIPSQAK